MAAYLVTVKVDAVMSDGEKLERKTASLVQGDDMGDAMDNASEALDPMFDDLDDLDDVQDRTARSVEFVIKIVKQAL